MEAGSRSGTVKGQRWWIPHSLVWLQDWLHLCLNELGHGHILSLIVCVVYKDIKAITILVVCWLDDRQECDLSLVSLPATAQHPWLGSLVSVAQSLMVRVRVKLRAHSVVRHTQMTQENKEPIQIWIIHNKQHYENAMTTNASVQLINAKLASCLNHIITLPQH